MDENTLFTYPQGWQEIAASLTFLPEEQREPVFEQAIIVFCSFFV